MFNKLLFYICLLLLFTACKNYQTQVVSKQNTFENKQLNLQQYHIERIFKLE